MGDEVVPAPISFGVQLLCSVGLAASYYISRSFYSLNFMTDAARVLSLFVAIEGPLVVGLYSLVQDAPQKCGYWKAVGRGLLLLPFGALLNAFVAVILGAPVGLEHWVKTINWSLLMSLFIFVPASCVFGSSKEDWQRLLVHSKTTKRLDYMASLPAHGAVLGGWVGAWPMPLDWERPWQTTPDTNDGNAIGFIHQEFPCTQAVPLRCKLCCNICFRFLVQIKGALSLLLVQEWPMCVTYGAQLLVFVGHVRFFCIHFPWEYSS